MKVSRVCLFAATMLLTGCLDAQQEAINSASLREIVCIDQVQYIAVPVKQGWAMSAHYKPDGSLYTCTNSVPKSHILDR
jgi:hypothetical protein